MKTAKLLVLVCCALLIALPLGSTLAQTPTPNTYGILTSTPQADGSIYHIVQPGESLWVISNAYGIPGSEIMVLNGNSPEAEEVYIGQVLLIRRANTPTPTSNVTPTPIPTTPQPTVFVPSRTPIPTKTPCHPNSHPAAIDRADLLRRQPKGRFDYGSDQRHRLGACSHLWLPEETALIRDACPQTNASSFSLIPMLGIAHRRLSLLFCAR